MNLSNGSRKIIIAHVVYSFATGGIENGIVNIVNNINKEKYFHVICCLTQTGNFESRLLFDNYIIYSLNKREGNDVSVPIKLIKIFRSHKVDIVHLRGWTTLVEGVIAAKIAHAQSIVYGFHGKGAGDVDCIKLRRKYSEKFALKFVDKVITLSNVMKSDYLQYSGVTEDFIDVIYNGVDTDKFKRMTEHKKLKYDFGFKDKDTVIGSIGRLDPVKDFDMLLRSFKQIYNYKNNTKLLIAGDGPEFDKLQKMAFELGIADNTVFAGHRDDINNILNVIDIYTQTSIYEGFSNTILEAMSSSLPAVVTNVGGNSFLIQDNENGFLVERGMDDRLCEKLSVLISNADLRERFGKLSRTIVLEKFSVKKMVEDYDRFYSNIFKQKLSSHEQPVHRK